MIKKLRQYNIHVNYIKISMEIWGIVYQGSDGHYYIAINDRIGYNQQQNVLKHELRHIEYDLPQYNYLVGVNMQYTELENNNKDSSLCKLLNSL